MGFRYSGRLQSIHFVERYQVIDDFHDYIPEIPRGAARGPHYLYHLGPPIIPTSEVRTGTFSGRAAAGSCLIYC